MDRSDHMQATSKPSASERIFTTAQAKCLGVPRNALAKACAAGRLLRVMHGVYRMAGVPSAETDEFEASWKLTAPSLFTHERVQPSAWDGIAAGGATAASIHGVGDFYLSLYILIAPQRARSRFPGVTFAARELLCDDVIFKDGLPVTRIERMILDLVLLGEDPSLVRDALADARKAGLDEDRLRYLIGACGSARAAERVRMALFGREVS